MSDPLRIILVGAGGRMGTTVARLAEAEPGLTIVAGLKRDDLHEGAMDGGDVVIDFSLAAATESVCQICAAHHRPLVLGTTGQSERQKKAVAASAEKIPIVFSANFGIGVNVLFALVRQAASSLGKSFDIEIGEAHHKTKKDAPSGTAKHLAELCARENGEVPVHSVRAGDIVGDHTVIFTGNGERLELTHRASNREIFARGALRAARWVIDQPPGLYTMEDVLGLAVAR